MAVPDPAMLVVLKLPQVNPLGMLAVSATVPEKPFREVNVIVVVLDWPALLFGGFEAVREKSGCFIVNVAVVEWVREPLVPVMDSVYEPPAVALQDTVAVPELDRLVGLMDPQVKPDGMLSVNETVPVNPFCAATVIVDVVLWPALTADGDEAVMLKSGWFAVNVAVAV